MTTSHAKPQALRARDAERRQLIAWLHEWAVAGVLAAEADLPSAHGMAVEPAPDIQPAASTRGTAFSAGASRRSRRNTRCAPGDIRLIHPADNGHDGLPPLYVAVVSAAAQGGWLLVPFGRFSTPAVASEWRTGLKAMPLRVLCLWNARTVPDTLAAHSWFAGRLSLRLLARARTLCAEVSAQATDGIPAGRPDSNRRTVPEFGPPLVHPLDPRWMYLSQEADRVEATFAAAGLTHCNRSTGPSSRYPLAGDTMLKAAEDKPDFSGSP